MPTSLFFLPLGPLPVQHRHIKQYRHRFQTYALATPRTTLNLSTTTSVSESAIEAIRNAYTTANAAIHHGTCNHALGRAAAKIYEKARQSIACLINADHTSEIIFAPSEASATELLARSLSTTLKRGDEIILTATEPDQTRRIWASAAIRKRLKLRIVYPDDSGEIPFEDIASLLSSRTRLVVLQAACPLLGTFFPLKDITEFIRGTGVPVLINATHILRYSNIDVRHLHPDFLIADGAFLGAPHSAFLYGRQERLQRLPPCFGGDEVLEDFAVDADLDVHNWSSVPERFGVGMPSISCAAAIGAVADDMLGRKEDSFIQRSEQLAVHLGRKLRACPRMILYGAKAERRIPVASFNVAGVETGLLADELMKRGMNVEWGCHNARMAHLNYLECPASLRVGFDPERHRLRDVDKFVRGLTLSIQTLV